MDAKIIFILIGIIHYCHCAGLLRTPKVYNAVITTDEHLTPSRAFPVIQPTIHETGIATYPFGPFNPYRYYNSPIVHFGPPAIPHGLFPREQYSFQIPVPHSPSQDVEPESNPEQRMLPPELELPPQHSPPSSNKQQQQQQQQSSPLQPPPPPPPTEEKAPIPLNEFGLPPSLVPLQSHPPYQNPITLQPYTYSHYPLIFEQSLRQLPPSDHYLPHYGYYPPHTYSIRPQLKKTKNQTPVNNAPAAQSSSNNESPEQGNELNNIKNGTGNKNSEVPDVPPPPLPSGAKTSQ